MTRAILRDSTLEYRFAWRWLLPIVKGQWVMLLGFTKLEQEFWKEVLLDVVITEDATLATLCLINELLPTCAADWDFKRLRCLCVVGSRRLIDAWHREMVGCYSDVQDYALLPSNNPRLVVPLGKSEWIMQGLALHRPGRWTARTAVVLMMELARVGVFRPLRARMVFIANKRVGIQPQGARQAGLELSSEDAPQSFALYLGTPNDNRKTVILPLGRKRGSILKHGESPKAQAALHNETVALRAIGQTSLATQVPAVIKLVEREGSVTLHQEYRPRKRRAVAGMRRAAASFLSELSRQNRRAQSLIKVLADSGLMTGKQARETGQLAYATVREHLDELAATGTMVWGHRSHGDFAPWNCAWTTKGFFVYDWEASRSWGLALGDAFYFAVVRAALVARFPNAIRVERDALEFAASVVKGANLPLEGIRIYWLIWLLQRMSFQPGEFYTQLLDRQATSS